MSVTVSAVPFLLFSEIISAGAFISTIAKAVTKKDVEHYELSAEEIKQIFQNEIETNFVDREALIKTLKEHGAIMTNESGGTISCVIEQFTLDFYKKNNINETPYTLKVSCDDCTNLEETMNDISAEYAENAQEISYNLIKERLEERHLNIDSEEVYEDNTIVLTVNLE